MGWQVTLTPEAEADVQDAVSFIAERSPAAARRIGEALLDFIFALDEFPRRGAPVLNRPGLRKLTYRHRLVVYRVAEDAGQVEIIRIWDGRRDPAGSGLG